MWDHRNVPATVLIVDDHAAFRASARDLLELAGFAVVGEAVDAASALRLARVLEPDLVLLDIALPDRSGFEVAAELASLSLDVVLVSSRAQRDLGRRVGECGALGFLSKEHLSGPALLALLERAA
jgi:two-component system response regulator EvgA